MGLRQVNLLRVGRMDPWEVSQRKDSCMKDIVCYLMDLMSKIRGKIGKKNGRQMTRCLISREDLTS